MSIFCVKQEIQEYVLFIFLYRKKMKNIFFYNGEVPRKSVEYLIAEYCWIFNLEKTQSVDRN